MSPAEFYARAQVLRFAATALETALSQANAFRGPLGKEAAEWLRDKLIKEIDKNFAEGGKRQFYKHKANLMLAKEKDKRK